MPERRRSPEKGRSALVLALFAIIPCILAILGVIWVAEEFLGNFHLSF